MPLFGDDLLRGVTALVRRRHDTLSFALGERSAPASSGEPSVWQRDLTLLIRVANGELTRTDALVRDVDAALSRVLDVLLGNALQIPALLPDEFWKTEIGVVVSRVRWWVWSDDLITISNAAALAFGENTQANRMRIVRAVDRGVLDWVPDPSVANPQQNRRVLRPQVERLRDLRRLPE